MILIGDVHEEYSEYEKILHKYPNHSTVQIGDMGFNYLPLYKIYADYRGKGLHWFFKGNHDNYNVSPIFDLGNFGMVNLEPKFFLFVVRVQLINIREH